MKAEFGKYATPRGPGLSEKQLDGAKNLNYHVEEALDSFKNGDNNYALSEEQFSILRQFKVDFSRDPTSLQAYMVTSGLTDGFQLATNFKYPKGIIIIETIEEATVRDVRALARVARRTKIKAEKAVNEAREAVVTARKEAGNAKEIDDYAEAGRKIKQKEEEYRKTQQQVEKIAKNVERLEKKVKDVMERLKDKV